MLLGEYRLPCGKKSGYRKSKKSEYRLTCGKKSGECETNLVQTIFCSQRRIGDEGQQAVA